MAVVVPCMLFCQAPEKNKPTADYAALPYLTHERLILVQATVEGLEGFLILDTGAPGLVLNRHYFDRSPGGNFGGGYGVNGYVEDVTTRRVSMEIATLYWREVPAQVYDLQHLKIAPALRILGLMGAAVLQEFEIVFDRPGRLLHFYRLDRRGDPRLSGPAREQPAVVLPYRLKGHLPVLDVQVGEHRLAMGLDSGAGISLLNRSREEALSPRCQAVGAIRLTGMGKSKLRSMVVHLRGIMVGPLALSPLRIAFIDLMHLNTQLPGPWLDGMLGFDFIYQRKTAINFRKRALYLWDGAHDPASVTVNSQ